MGKSEDAHQRMGWHPPWRFSHRERALLCSWPSFTPACPQRSVTSRHLGGANPPPCRYRQQLRAANPGAAGCFTVGMSLASCGVSTRSGNTHMPLVRPSAENRPTQAQSALVLRGGGSRLPRGHRRYEVACNPFSTTSLVENHRGSAVGDATAALARTCRWHEICFALPRAACPAAGSSGHLISCMPQPRSKVATERWTANAEPMHVGCFVRNDTRERIP